MFAGTVTLTLFKTDYCIEFSWYLLNRSSLYFVRQSDIHTTLPFKP